MLSSGKYVWRKLGAASVLIVHVYVMFSIDWIQVVRVYCYQHHSDVSLKKIIWCEISLLFISTMSRSIVYYDGNSCFPWYIQYFYRFKSVLNQENVCGLVHKLGT